MRVYARRVLSCILCFVMLVSAFPAQSGYAAGVSELVVEDVYTDKAMYSPSDSVVFTITVSNYTSTDAVDVLQIEIFHLNNSVATDTIQVTVGAYKTVELNYTWRCPTADFTGYMVKVSSTSGSAAVTAVDVSSDFSRFPRYGYTADFDLGETSEESRKLVEELAQKYHINVIQYYDWMWRHEQVIPTNGATYWEDMFGNIISKDSIAQRISASASLNQSSMAYQMAYMAREGYEAYGVKKEWGLYRDKQYNTTYSNSDLSTINNISQLIFPLEGNPPAILHVFNPENEDWQNYMIEQYETAISELGFDGIHIDQMGSYWGSIDYYDYFGNYVDLKNTFPSFVDAVKERLTNDLPGKSYVTMNMVNGGTPSTDTFSSELITKYADTDFSFSEIWENSNTYNSLKNFIEWNREESGGKALVLAAYMNQYENLGDSYEAEAGDLNGVTVGTSNEGVTYVTGFDNLGDALTFSVEVPEDGYYCLVFTYSNGTENRGTKDVYIDGEKCLTANFDPTRTGTIPAAPSWAVFSSENAFTAPKTLFLSAGTHTIALQQGETSTGDIQVDKLTLGMFNEPSVRITDAAIAASGASHIEIGTGLSAANSDENYSTVSMLGHPYYPKAFKSMSSSLETAMKAYYNFITGYENLLYDTDITASDGGLQNIQISKYSVSGSGEPGKIWFINKNKSDDYSIVHLINLTSEQDTDWRNATAEPDDLKNLEVKYYYTNDRTVEGVYVATPDDGMGLSQGITYSLGSDSTGKYISFVVPSLLYWDMVYIKWASQGSTDKIEAEDMILAGVSVGHDHPNYSGSGFVDGFGDLYDSVSFDVTVEEDGYYTLGLVYANSTGAECSRELFVDNQSRGKVTFLNGGSWDEWRSTEKGVFLSAGQHRLVLLVTEEYGGFINLDYVEVSPLMETSRSLYLNNWENTNYIWKAADVNPAQARLADGPSIYEMRYYDGSVGGDYNVNQIKNYSMFLRDIKQGVSYTTGSAFDATGYFDDGGVLNTTYTAYNGTELPIEVNRNYVVVPNEQFMIVQYEVSNLTGTNQEFSLLDMLHLDNSSSNSIVASYQDSHMAIVADMTATGQYVIAHGSFDAVNGFQVANDSDSNLSSSTCSPWVTFNNDGTLMNNRSVTAQDISTAFVKTVNLSAHETQTFSFYTAICGSTIEMESVLKLIESATADEWISKTRSDYAAWLAEGKQTDLPDSKLNEAFDSILVFQKQSIVPGSYQDASGATVYKFAAMPATTNPSAYSYKVWARDSAVTAMALDASGHLDEAEAYWLWLADRQIKTDEGDWKQPGAFWTCYWVWDNSPVSFVEPEHDSVGMFLIGAYRHYKELANDKKAEFLERIWPAYRLSADLVCSNIQESGLGAADCSIWEEQFEYNAFTQALYVAGLDAAQFMASEMGLQDVADSYNGAAGTIRSAIQRSSTDNPAGLYNTTDAYSDWWYYNRAVNLDGTPRTTVDSSSNVLMTYGVIDMQSKRAYTHYRKITATIGHDELGISRYQGDTFYTGKNSWDPGGAEALEDEPSWPQMTMWVALMELYSGYDALAERGYERLQWYVDRTAMGYMPAGESVSNITLKPMLSTMCEPITGAAYIITALAYDQQFDTRIIPQQYNAGAYSQIAVHDGCATTVESGATVSDWAQWSYIPYYIDEINDSKDSSIDISRVYICNDQNNLYIRIDTAGQELPGYQAAGNLFDVAVYSEDFAQGSVSTANCSLRQSSLERNMAYAVVRASNSNAYEKYTASAGSWNYSKDIQTVIAPQWETGSGRIELVIPLSELSSTGSVSANTWANMVIALGHSSGASWEDVDFFQIHYRITDGSQAWLFGNSEA